MSKPRHPSIRLHYPPDVPNPLAPWGAVDLHDPTCPRCGDRLAIQPCYRRPFRPAVGIAPCPQRRLHLHLRCSRCGVEATARMPASVVVEAWAVREQHGEMFEPWPPEGWTLDGDYLVREERYEPPAASQAMRRAVEMRQTKQRRQKE